MSYIYILLRLIVINKKIKKAQTNKKTKQNKLLVCFIMFQ